jgi:hypothetical protein
MVALTFAGAVAAQANGREQRLKQNVADPLCNFGVNVNGSITPFDTAPLRIGWYLDYHALAAPDEPNGADYAPVIRIQQVGADQYAYAPSGAALTAVIAGNPGAVWLVGNEPDSIWQDNLEPHVYAAAYHELYYLIKGEDPTARIFAGSIVQPTSIRLLYLDMVLDSYRESFAEQLPVDGWSIHNFILNEVEWEGCTGDICWGAWIPPGINVPHGEILLPDDHDSVALFVERIERFRQWMADRGYHGLPVYISEFGILAPPDYYSGFPPSRVNAFMNNTFDYLLNTTDHRLGDPNDEYRVIQELSWFSTNNYDFNGWLYEPIGPGIYQLSPMGLNYAAYVAGIVSEVDLYPSRIFTDPASPYSPTEPVTITLKATVANSGNVITHTGPVAVRFYDGDPGAGGQQIGPDQSVSLTGCGHNQTVSVVWAAVTPGAHLVYVVVDPDGQVDESDESNNIASQAALVATERAFAVSIQR